VHPLEGGALRRKVRRDRRPSLPRESALVFYPRYALETMTKFWGYSQLFREWRRIRKEVAASPERWSYTDTAIAAATAEDAETLSLYHATSGGEAALARQRRHEAIRARTTAATLAPSIPSAAAE
jgi:hypothetical protein